MMLVAMRQELLRQLGQLRGNVFEMGNTDGEHHLPGRNCLTIVEPQTKSTRQTVETDNHPVFQLRHHSPPKGEPVGSEGIKSNWNA